MEQAKNDSCNRRKLKNEREVEIVKYKTGSRRVLLVGKWLSNSYLWCTKILKPQICPIFFVLPASMPMTKHLSVAIIDSSPALGSNLCIKKEDPPDPRVSTVTPASISFLRGIQFLRSVIHSHCCFNFKFSVFLHFFFEQM